MRKRTDKEKEAMGPVEVIFRQLGINKIDGGYAPLLDCIIYAYAFPDKEFREVVNFLSIKNHYLHIREAEKVNATRIEKIYSEMVHTIKSTIDCPDKDYLRTLELDVMEVILGKRDEELEKVLPAEIGEENTQSSDNTIKYSNDEKIVLFFIKKILKAVKNGV